MKRLIDFLQVHQKYSVVLANYGKTQPLKAGPLGRIRIPGARRFQGRLIGSAIIGPGDSATRMECAMGVKSARK